MLEMLVVAKLMVPACSRCCWEHARKGAEGSTLAKGCAHDRGAASCVAAEAALVQMVCARENLCRGQKEDEKINGNENMIKTERNRRGSEGYVIYKNVKL